VSDLKFSKDHEWLRVEGDTATIGISDYAQEQLGDVVYVELPEIGQNFSAGAQAAVVESVKAASEIYVPAGGEVVEVNNALDDNPALVNSDATGQGWFIKLKLDNAAELEALMDENSYQEFIAGLE